MRGEGDRGDDGQVPAAIGRKELLSALNQGLP